ncbi:Kinesin light chain 3, partial [Blyttiomyces sp. JEL0837]
MMMTSKEDLASEIDIVFTHKDTSCSTWEQENTPPSSSTSSPTSANNDDNINSIQNPTILDNKDIHNIVRALSECSLESGLESKKDNLVSVDLSRIGFDKNGQSLIKPTNREIQSLKLLNHKEPLAISPFGINLAFLHLLIETCGGRTIFEGLTTNQVSEQLIKPLTIQTGLSLCDTLAELGRNDLVQVADIFISHAWVYSFMDMIDAIDAYIKESNRLPQDVYLWIDLVSNSQHETFERPFRWWETTFINAIRGVQEVVLVLQPWDYPIPLRRAWCIYEIFACHLIGSQLHVAMSPRESQRMLDSLSEDKASGYKKMLAQVSCVKSEASVERDREKIFEVIRDLTSIDEMDRLVFDVFTKSIVRRLERQVEIAKEGGDGDEGKIVDWELVLAQVLFQLSLYHEAEPLCKDAVERCEATYGSEHVKTIAAKQALLDLVSKYKPNEEVFKLATELLDLNKRIRGPDDLKTLDNLNVVASIHFELGRLDKAEEGFKEMLERSTRRFGPEHPIAVEALSNIGVVYSTMGKRDESIDIMKRIVAVKKSLHGDGHVDTLIAIQNLYITCLNARQTEEAEPLAQECYLIRKRVLGEEHLETVMNLTHLANIHNDRGDYITAQEMFTTAYHVLKRTQGPQHHDTIYAMMSVVSSYIKTGNWVLGLELCNEGIDIAVKTFGATHERSMIMKTL